jgi:cytochrome c553
MRVIAAIVLAGAAVTGMAESPPESTPDIVLSRCQTCHGERGSAAIPGWPEIAGLPQAVFSSKLKGYRGQQNPESVMAEAAHDLSDEEIAQLARYYEALAH